MGTPRSTKIGVHGEGSLNPEQLASEETLKDILDSLSDEDGAYTIDVLKEIVSKLQQLNGRIGVTTVNGVMRAVIDSGVITTVGTITTVSTLTQLATGNYSTLPSNTSDILSRLNGQFTLR